MKIKQDYGSDKLTIMTIRITLWQKATDSHHIIHVKHPSSKMQGEPNVTPMINVIFLLLLYFMVAGSLTSQDAIPVTPPVSISNIDAPRLPSEIIVTADGLINFADRQGRIDDFSQLVKDAGLKFSSQTRLKADASADAGLVAEIIEVLGQSGVERIVLITSRRSNSKVSRQ